MTIKGFVHINLDEAFYAEVDIVRDIRFYAGEYVGWMQLAGSDEVVEVKRHPCGNYNGSIVRAEDF